MAQLRDIMTTKVVTTSADRPVAEVTAMMVKARRTRTDSCLPRRTIC